jgi:hypothetical protein
VLERKEYDEFRVAPLDPAVLRARDVEHILKKLVESSGGRLTIEKFAESVEGRPIYKGKIGAGPRRVLLWSQMHGDEPTHTAVLLDLVNYLLQKPSKAHAEEILSGCALHFIPMLNPDGAEAVVRYNAQGIDINRDARRLATPEGRALRHAVEVVKPEYGFNLHNQHARTSVGKPPKPAAMSVLAPAPDAAAHETPSWRRAKQMCAVCVEAVRPLIPGMISRYDDTHEPRAFGDTIQATGASTMLIEAGGWPEKDIEPLTRVHFHGMLAVLSAIATDKCGDADIKIYETLPQSNSARQLDCVIAKANVLTPVLATPFVADLGIAESRTERLGGRAKSDGRIVEIGDLAVLSAKTHVDGSEWLVLPGQVAFSEEWSPETKVSPQQIDSLLAKGVTTLIGCIDLGKEDPIDSVSKSRDLPFNWGFVGRIDKTGSLANIDVVERVATAAHQGLLAIATTRANEEVWQQLQRLGLPLVQLGQLTAASAGGSYQDLSQHAGKICQLLNLDAKRGRVGRDSAADLTAFALPGKADAKAAVNWHELARVVVAGETVWESGKRIGGTPGVFLRRT